MDSFKRAASLSLRAAVAAALLLTGGPGAMGQPARGVPSVVGRWYGRKEGSPVTVEFRKDRTVTIDVAANSNSSFTCSYQVDYGTTPVSLDLSGIHSESFNMACAAIISFDPPRSDREMEIYGVLGPRGVVQRPREIVRDSPRYDVLYLKLSRDPAAAREPEAPAPAPRKAALAFARNRRLGRGLNLVGVLDGERVQPMNPEYFKKIRGAGFTNLRVPIRWSAHCAKHAPYTIDPSFFREVDRIVRLGLRNGLALALDIHYYPGINMPAEESTESFDDNVVRFTALWEQIAAHYRAYPPEVYFTILNEPNRTLGAARWNELVAKSLKIIRKTNPGRTVLVGTPDLGQSWTIGLLKLPRDDWNLIVEIHCYTPATFTHQGASWVPGSQAWLGTHWTGTPGEKAAVEKDLGFCTAWGKRHHRPLCLSEFGAIDQADLASRARWIAFVRKTAESDGMSFALWAFTRSPFDVFDEKTGRWIRPLLDALLPARSGR